MERMEREGMFCSGPRKLEREVRVSKFSQSTNFEGSLRSEKVKSFFRLLELKVEFLRREPPREFIILDLRRMLKRERRSCSTRFWLSWLLSSKENFFISICSFEESMRLNSSVSTREGKKRSVDVREVRGFDEKRWGRFCGVLYICFNGILNREI